MTFAAVYALLTSFALDVYALCVHQDGQSHIEISQGIDHLTYGEAGSEHLSCSADDCVDKAISDAATQVVAKILNDDRPDTNSIAIVWNHNPTTEITLANIPIQILTDFRPVYATVIKPTTVLLT